MKKLVLCFLALTLLTGCVPVAPTVSPPVATPPVESMPASIADYVPTHDKYDAGETDNPRWYAETTLELLPRDDYGMLYPYPGAARRNWWEGWMDYASYGFCTADGVLVTDPAFTSVQYHEYGDRACYTFRRSFGYDWDDHRENTVYLAAADGRFVQGYDEVREAGENAFAVRTGDRWGAVDYGGHELLPCEYEFVMVFSEDLAAVTRDFDTGYEYVDRTGRTVFTVPPGLTRAQVVPEGYEDWDLFTTFFNRITFHDGRAVFWTEDGHFGYLDTSGNVAIPARYGGPEMVMMWHHYTAGFQDGVAVIPTGWDESVAIGVDGVELALGTDAGAESTGSIWRVGDVLTRDVTRVVNGVETDDIEFYTITGRPLSREEAQARIEAYAVQAGAFSDGTAVGYRDADGTVLLKPAYRRVEKMGDCFVVIQWTYGGLVDGAGRWIVKRYLPLDMD